MSIEGSFQPGSDDYVKEGWGDMEKTPTLAPKPRNWILRAVATQDAMSVLSKAQDGRLLVWALTYHYAYPFLEKGMVLRVMRKYADGRRLSWRAFELFVERGEHRIAAVLK